MRDGSTPLSIASKTGDLDLRHLQKYSPDPTRRNYSQKSMEQQLPTYQAPTYLPTQPRINSLQHPSDHRISPLPHLLPSTNLMHPDHISLAGYFRSLSFINPTIQDRLPASGMPYPFDHSRGSAAHKSTHPHNIDRLVPIANNYSNAKHGTPGQPLQSFHSIPKSYPNPDGTSKSLANLNPFPMPSELYLPSYNAVKYERGRETDASLSKRHKQVNSPSLENYKPYLNNSPLPSYSNSNHYVVSSNHSLMKTSTYDTRKPPGLSGEVKAIKSNDTSVIDLTSCNSPDMQVSTTNTAAKGVKPQTVPPLSSQASSTKTKDYYVQPSTNNNPSMVEYATSAYGCSVNTPYLGTVVNSDYRTPRPLGTGFGFQQPSYHAPSSSDQVPYNLYDSLAESNRAHSAKGIIDSTLQKPPTLWPPSNYLTPPPQPYIPLDSRTKNESPSLGVKSKTLPQPTSDLAFNYPEGSKLEHPHPTMKYPCAPTDNGVLYRGNTVFPGGKMPWAHKDDSQLSPYEKHVLSAARESKSFSKLRPKTYNSILDQKHRRVTDHNFIQQPLLDTKKNEHKNYPSYGHVYTNLKKTPSPVPINGAVEVSRNSVIQSTPKVVEKEEYKNSAIESTLQTTSDPSIKSSASDAKQSILEDVIRKEIGCLDNQNRERRDGQVRLEATKSPTICKDNSNNKQDTPCVENTIAISSDLPRKRKFSNAKDHKKRSKKKCSIFIDEDDDDTAAQTGETSKSELPSAKTTRRPRRSGDMDEYLYGWVMSSDDDTENDDSSDEDYNCPTKVALPKAKGSKGITTTKLRTRRTTLIQQRNSKADDTKEQKAPCPVESVEISIYKKENKKSPHKKEEKKQKVVKVKERKRRSKSSVDSSPEANAEQNSMVENKERGRLKSMDTASEDDGLDRTNSDKEIEIPAYSKKEKTDAKIIPKHGKKRKYTRRLDKDGVAWKKSKKLKAAEEDVPRKKRKYIKSLLKDSLKLKKLNKKILKSKMEQSRKSEISKVHPAISPALVELYTNSSDQSSEKSEHEKAKLSMSPKYGPENTLSASKKSPGRRKNSRDVPEEIHNNNNASSALLHAVSNLLNEQKSQNKEQIKSCPEESKNKTNTEASHSIAATEKSRLSSQEPPVKIRKKPGRKPGWRKHAANNSHPKQKQTSDDKGLPKKTKKPKKQKGDGLPRFGMRKRGRGKNKHKIIKSRAFIPVLPELSESSLHEKKRSVTKLLKNKDLPLAHSETEKRTGRQCFRNKRLSDGNFLHVDCLDLDADRGFSTDEDRVTRKQRHTRCSMTEQHRTNRDVNKISKELQSQEYDYVFDSELSLYNNDDQPCTSRSFIPIHHIKQESISDCPPSPFLQCQSRPATPIGSTPIHHQSPLPPNFKKLWCNSAIGETQLHKAARNGFIDNLLYYLERGTNVNQCDNAGYTALHEACVHNHLEAAMLLLQYGADVNKNAVDGTRPLHDAVEYDHIDMARLMLASGADPLLSKFSGRAILNMIRSRKMGNFIQAYLKELKDVTEELCEDKELEWMLPCSAVYDIITPHAYSVLDDPPQVKVEDTEIEFELYEEPPFPTFLLQPDDESERANFCLLDDFLKATERKKAAKDINIRIHTITAKNFHEQIQESRLHCTLVDGLREKETMIELVLLDSNLSAAAGAEIIRVSRPPKEKDVDKAPAHNPKRHIEYRGQCNMQNMQGSVTSEDSKCRTMPKLSAESQVSEQASDALENPDCIQDNKTNGASPAPSGDGLCEESIEQQNHNGSHRNRLQKEKSNCDAVTKDDFSTGVPSLLQNSQNNGDAVEQNGICGTEICIETKNTTCFNEGNLNHKSL